MRQIQKIEQVEQVMTSREIAELTEKRHDHVLRDCEVLNENYVKMGLPKIGDTLYKHSQNGQQYREFRLTRMQTFDLMTGYNIELRIKVNRRWEELEQTVKNNLPALPTTFAEALRLAANQAEQIEKQQAALNVAEGVIQDKNKELKVAEPKIMYFNKAMTSNGVYALDIAPKVLKMPFGRTKFVEFLKSQNLLMKYGKPRPLQQFVKAGYFTVDQRVRTNQFGATISYDVTLITAKGLTYISELWDKYQAKK